MRSAMDFLKGLVDSKKRTLDGPQGSGPKKWKRRGDVAKEKAAVEVEIGIIPTFITITHNHNSHTRLLRRQAWLSPGASWPRSTRTRPS